MSILAQEELFQLIKLFDEVGSRLSALDHDERNSDTHWGIITENETKIIEIAGKLPEEIQVMCPELMRCINSKEAIYIGWFIYRGEIKAILDK